MSKVEYITLDELQNAIEKDTSDNKFKTCAEFFLDALTDWPTYNLREPKHLIDALKSEIRKPLTFDNLDSYGKNLELNVSGNMWKLEAVTALLEMFHPFQNLKIISPNLFQ